MSQRRHNPRRFQEFEEFKDGSGFSIYEHGHDIYFYYDQDGGWFDEYGNYYNSNCEPDQPKAQSKRFWDQIKHKYGDDDLDDILNEYDNYSSDGGDDNYDIEKEFQIKEEINKMKTRLRHYPDNQEIKIYFKDAEWKLTENQFKKELGNDLIKSVHFNQQKNYKTGDGYLIAFDKKAAEQIINKHYIEIGNSEIKFSIEALDHIDSDDDIDIPQQQIKQEQQKQQQQQQQQQQQKQSQSQSQSQQQSQQQQQQQQKPIQQQQQIQQQTQSTQETKQSNESDLFYLVVDNFPEKESEKDVLQWFGDKSIDSLWINYEYKNREKEKCSAIRLHFDDKDRLEKIRNELTKHKMYKGKCTLKIK